MLSLFGIPYITSPMEAEAQCAALNMLGTQDVQYSSNNIIGLVDGIVTDDSDVFLFGGETVYRKFFDQNNFIEAYKNQDIKQQLGLDRTVSVYILPKNNLPVQALINLALLLGSDYTNGVKGIGIVLAVEILHEFGDLERFKAWLSDPSLDPAADDVTPLKKKLVRQISLSCFIN